MKGARDFIKIQLTFSSDLDLEALESNILLESFRLKASVKLFAKTGWTKSFEAIVDTGSPMTLLPKSVWEHLQYEILSPKELGILGISPDGTPSIHTKLAKVNAVFLDNENISQPAEIRVRLFPDDTVPVLIGFLDVLNRFKLVMDFPNNMAFFEF